MNKIEKVITELQAECKACITNLTEGLNDPNTRLDSCRIYRNSISHHRMKLAMLDEILDRADAKGGE